MKRLAQTSAAAILALFAGLGIALAEVEISITANVFVTQDAGSEGKQYIAYIGEDAYTSEGSLLVFGDQDGQLKVRNFWKGLQYFYPKKANFYKSFDNFYNLSIEVVEDDTVRVNFEGMKPGYDYDFIYKKTDVTSEMTSFIKLAANKYYDATYKKWLAEGVPTTLAKFKHLLELHQRSHVYQVNEKAEFQFQFATEYLQTEFDTDFYPANEALKNAIIKMDASDAISQSFGVTSWSNEFPLSASDVDWSKYPDYNSKPEFFTYYKGADTRLIEKELFKKSFEIFTRYTLVKAVAFECESRHYIGYSVSWYLVDGSVFSYDQYTECD